MATTTAVDTFYNTSGVPTGSASNAVTVVPNDNDDLEKVTRGVYVGGAGDLAVNMFKTGDAIVFHSVPAGTFLPIRISRVLAAGTTATNITAVW